MQRALLFQSDPAGKIKCGICRRHCRIAEDSTGVCRMYKNSGGTLYSLNYGLASSVAVDPIEKKPLNHFYPGSQVYSLGSWGCNFHCPGCQNWQIACADADSSGRNSHQISPQQAVEAALENDCRGIAWTYNEPTVWFEYTLDSAKLAKDKGLYTVYVTNGYMSQAALDLIGPYLDAFRVDIKGFKAETYRRLAGISDWEGILRNTERAAKHWHCHVEVVTNVTPGINDDEQQLNGIAGWINSCLGPLTPWHVTRFYPQFKAVDLPPTPVATLEKAISLGQQHGLKFIYTGNVPGHAGQNTRCYRCGKTVVERSGYTPSATGLNGAACKYCGADLNFRV